MIEAGEKDIIITERKTCCGRIRSKRKACCNFIKNNKNAIDSITEYFGGFSIVFGSIVFWTVVIMGFIYLAEKDDRNRYNSCKFAQENYKTICEKGINQTVIVDKFILNFSEVEIHYREPKWVNPNPYYNVYYRGDNLGAFNTTIGGYAFSNSTQIFYVSSPDERDSLTWLAETQKSSYDCYIKSGTGVNMYYDCYGNPQPTKIKREILVDLAIIGAALVVAPLLILGIITIIAENCM